MKNIISGLIGIYLLFMMAYTPIYVLFFNSGSDAVKSMSLEDGLYFSTVTNIDSQAEDKERKKLISDFAKEYKKHTGIDITKPIYALLDKNSNVKNLTIKEDERTLKGDVKSYGIFFEVKDKKFIIPFIVKEPSFIHVKTAKAYILLDLKSLLGIVGPIYNISQDDLAKIHMIFDRHIPSN